MIMDRDCLLVDDMRWILAASMLVSMLGFQTQGRTPAEPTVLLATDSHTLGIPPLVSIGRIGCNGNDHIFYRMTPPNYSLNDSLVMRLDIKSETPTVYEQPTEFAGKVALTDFGLTQTGRVWYLDEMKEGGYTAVGFDSDGKAMTQTRLDTPADLFVTSFAVSDDGSILVGGFFVKEAPSELRGKSYLAFFGRSGALAKEVGRDLPNQDLEAFSTGEFVNKPVQVGIDGNFYVLDDNVVLVMSESGEIVRRMKFQSPGGHAYNIILSADLLSIEFLLPVGDTRVLKPEFLVLESDTGAPYGRYQASEELGSTCLCFSRKDGFLFSRSDNVKIKLITAPLR